MNKLLPVVDKILQFFPSALAILIPLTVLPVTTEFYETPKIALLILASVVLFLAWSLKMLSEKKVSFVRSPLDAALLSLLGVFLLSLIFSGNKLLVLTGSYLRFQPSLAVILSLIVIFYAVGANLRKEGRLLLLTSLALATSLGSFLAALSYFGLFDLLPPNSGPLLILKSRAFSPFGSSTTASVLCLAALILVLGLLNSQKKTAEKKDKNLELLLSISPFPLLALPILYGNVAVLASFVLVVVFLLLKEPQFLKSSSLVVLPLLVWALILAVLSFTPQIRGPLNLPGPVLELRLDLTNSWQIASQAVATQPLFGVGLGQYGNAFNLFKPLAFNSGLNWNIRFDRPANEVLLFLTELGILGVLAILFFMVRTVRFVVKNMSQNALASFISAAILLLIISFLLQPSTILINFSLILLLAVLVSLNYEEGNPLTPKVILLVTAALESSSPKDRIIKALSESAKPILPYLVLAGAVIYGLAALPATGVAFLAEFYNRQSVLAVTNNDGRQAYANQLKAVGLLPQLDNYQRSQALIALGIAANLSQRTDLSDSDRGLVRNLIQEAVQRVRFASEVAGQNAVVNWESRAQIYQNLINTAQGAQAWAVDAYARAIALDPINPNLRILLGGVYLSLNDNETALNSFSQAISLKPDLANAHYNLANALIKLNRRDEALVQYDIVLNLIGSGSPDFERAKKERDDLAKKRFDLQPSPAESQLRIQTPTTSVEKKSLTPPLELGRPGQEASPAAR